ncbi:maleylacetate reductase [Devosia enhydra]|uniref:Maleylacetate reductase n=1 Tax=Devosia enhydra TaxID=665118 RepID=A0A1K2I388_9HYPH|nr:maleylacetate reductase [Devosia enhydra]SFZ86854.1 maleylacetate reductase [Devosia enhydra]
MDFVYNANPSRVIFGEGSRARVAEELDRLGIERAIIISTPDQSALAAEIARSIGGRAGIMYPGAVQHTPVEVTESALLAVSSVRADGCLAIGGGSTTGLSKAIAYRTDLPQLVIPTTFAGSEMTPILGQTQAGRKTTVSDPKILPETVIYDPELTVTMPSFISGPSGMNAIAHSVEALYAKDRNPIISMLAEASIRALGSALPVLMEESRNLKAHSEALYGAWLAGVCLGAVGMAIHHKICHTLGGTFNLNHADIHALMIPYTSAYNREAAPDAMAAIARALSAADGPSGIYALTQRAATKRSLAEMGLTEADLDTAADLALQNPYYNPRPVTREGVRAMLQAAFEGRAP